MQIAFPRRIKKTQDVSSIISPHVSFQPLYFNEFGQQLLNGATKMCFFFGLNTTENDSGVILHLPKRFQPLTKIQIQLIANLNIPSVDVEGMEMRRFDDRHKS